MPERGAQRFAKGAVMPERGAQGFAVVDGSDAVLAGDAVMPERDAQGSAGVRGALRTREAGAR